MITFNKRRVEDNRKSRPLLEEPLKGFYVNKHLAKADLSLCPLPLHVTTWATGLLSFQAEEALSQFVTWDPSEEEFALAFQWTPQGT